MAIQRDEAAVLAALEEALRTGGMSAERTVKQLAAEIEHLTGVKIRIGGDVGVLVEDGEGGSKLPPARPQLPALRYRS
jgi:hypothetical protein